MRYVSLLGLLVLPFFGAETLLTADLFQPESASYRILWELRLPRILFACGIGAALGTLGGTYQSLFRNPLADPYVLGVSSAVILGMAVGESWLGLHGMRAIPVGIAAALATTAFLALAASRRFGQSTERILLFGMGINFVLSSALFLLLSYRSQQLGGGSLRWLFGQMPWPSIGEAVAVAALSVFTVASLWLAGRHLDAMSLGDGVAASLGVSPARFRLGTLIGTSLVLSGLVALTGAVGFVGLVVPHAARMLFGGGGLRKILLDSALLGALFLATADVASRAAAPPFEFPIGVVTTVLGGPLFLYLLWRNRA